MPFPFLSLNLTPEKVFNPTGNALKESLETVDATQRQKQEQFLSAKEDQKEYQKKFKSHSGALFKDVWKQLAELTVGHLADRLGVLGECKERGLDGLLKVKSVRLYVTWRVAYFYYTSIRGEKILQSDSRDHHHAVLASVADMFVTLDQRFARMLRLVPIDGFEVINLNTLLQRLRHASLFGFDAHEAN